MFIHTQYISPDMYMYVDTVYACLTNTKKQPKYYYILSEQQKYNHFIYVACFIMNTDAHKPTDQK